MLAANGQTHPAGVGEHVMRTRAPRGHKVASLADAKREVCGAIVVQMSNFSLLHAKLDTAKPMRKYRDTFPLTNDIRDALTDTSKRHHTFLSRDVIARPH